MLRYLNPLRLFKYLVRTLAKLFRRKKDKPDLPDDEIATGEHAAGPENAQHVDNVEDPESDKIRVPAAASANNELRTTFRRADYPGRIEVGIPTIDFQARPTDPKRFRQHPYRPDSVIDGWASDALTLRLASVRGDLHRYKGVPRQDDVAAAIHEASGSVIVAVSDGVSAAKDSHHGALAVCRYTVNALIEQLDNASDVDWRKVVDGAAWTLVQLVRRLNGDKYANMKDAEAASAAERECACTLTAAVVQPTPDGGASVTGVSIGDSALAVMSANRSERKVVPLAGGKSPMDGGLTSSAVTCLPRIPKDIPSHTEIVAPNDVLLIGTDGFFDPLDDGSGLLGDLIRQELAANGPPDLLQFARIVDFSRETFDDDRTLVGIWPKARPSTGTNQ